MREKNKTTNNNLRFHASGRARRTRLVCTTFSGSVLLSAALITTYAGGLQFDQSVTPEVIFGSGNVNGAFTIDQSAGVEVGLRAKLRFNENNQPENTFNSNGDGSYSYSAVVAPGGFSFDPNSPTTPVWNFEWSVNTDWDGSTANNLDAYTYEMQLDADPGPGTNFLTFDPITPGVDAPFYDHAIGDNTTTNGGGAVAGDATQYQNLLSNNNVAQNSWSYEFFNDSGPLAGFDPTVPGRYDITLTVLDGSSEVAHSTITLIVGTQLTLSTTEDWCANKDVGDSVTVDVSMQNADTPVAGGQFLIAYDADRLQFNNASGGDVPFDQVLFTDNDPLGSNDGTGTDYVLVAVGNSGTPDSTDADSLMAQLNFTILSEFCTQSDLVRLDSGMQPIDTILTDEQGDSIAFSPMDLPAQTVDDTAPTITCAEDINVIADAGGCDVTLDFAESFDSIVPTCENQTPNCWYVDRFAPAFFESAMFDGDMRLRHGVSVDDAEGNRPAGFNSAFYNTQGRKYDIDMPIGTTLSAHVYVPSDFQTNERRMGMWATTMTADEGDPNVISGFPIVGFTSEDNDSDGDSDPDNPRFRIFTQDVDQDGDGAGTAGEAGWIDLYSLSSGDFDKWYRFETTLTESAYEFRVIDVDTDTVIASFDDAITLGSLRFANVILQVYNFGETYEVHWDNVTLGPEGPIVNDNCGASSLAFERSDNASLDLNDPFPAGITTITWTATDDCGNASTCTQDVIVDGNNEAIVDLAYDGALDTMVDRCIEFEFTGSSGTSVVNQIVTFNASGEATGVSVLVPCGDYDCVTIRDSLHTLATSVPLNVNGTVYEADATGADAMLTGNLNQDNFIDILDFGVFVGEFQVDYGTGNTNCSTTPPHADITGDGIVLTSDFTSIQINFLSVGDTGCTSMLSYDGSHSLGGADIGHPLEQISVKELHRRGLGHLEVADLNNDNWLDQQDIAAFINGARP